MSEEINFDKILTNNPNLQDILRALNDNNIKYGLYAGAYVSIITSNRTPTDVDILIADEDFGKLENLFPGSLIEKVSDARFFYPYKDKKIEFMANADIDIGASHYKFRLTDVVWKNTSILNGNQCKVRLCNPVDTILLKAMLQRGSDEGKHDLLDVSDLIKEIQINKTYLKERMDQVNPDKRLLNALKGFQLI